MIGLFFGSTDFPKRILEKIKKRKIEYFIIDLTNSRVFKKNQNTRIVTKIVKDDIRPILQQAAFRKHGIGSK